MDNKNKNEMFFKNIASLYAEKEGENLKRELEEITKENTVSNTSALDRKMKSKLANAKIRKFSYAAMPVAACFLLALIYFSNTDKIGNTPPSMTAPIADATITAPPSVANDDTPAAQNIEIELLSAKLPSGYFLTSTDYDKHQTIYYIENVYHNNIMLIVEEAADTFEKDIFQETIINDTIAYALVKNDYSVLKYEKDNILYTLTSKYNYKDLIEISKNLI